MSSSSITSAQLIMKRGFDLVLSLVLMPIIIIPIVILILFASTDTRAFGLFLQKRVGQSKKPFWIYKIRTLKKEKHFLGEYDKSASKFGLWVRRTKLDELPQIINVLIGDMSFVGPRPDIVGFADTLRGEDQVILKVKPGITGPATLKYKNEDSILAKQDDPEIYNRTIIWPDKVKINKNYVENWSFYLDLTYILKSIVD